MSNKLYSLSFAPDSPGLSGEDAGDKLKFCRTPGLSFSLRVGVSYGKIEPAMYKRIGIVTGGGDAPGLNAVIRAVVKTAVCEFA
jgi:hypothetical protein